MAAGGASATPISVALVSTIGNTSFEQDVISQIQTIAPIYPASSVRQSRIKRPLPSNSVGALRNTTW